MRFPDSQPLLFAAGRYWMNIDFFNMLFIFAFRCRSLSKMYRQIFCSLSRVISLMTQPYSFPQTSESILLIIFTVNSVASLAEQDVDFIPAVHLQSRF